MSLCMEYRYGYGYGYEILYMDTDTDTRKADCVFTGEGGGMNELDKCIHTFSLDLKSSFRMPRIVCLHAFYVSWVSIIYHQSPDIRQLSDIVRTA